MTPESVAPRPTAPADDGLQQERTALAWRRTGLALLMATFILGRITAEAGGPVAFVLVCFGAALGAWAVAVTLRRGRWRATSSAESAFDSLLPDGRLPAALTVIVLLLCLAELLLLL